MTHSLLSPLHVLFDAQSDQLGKSSILEWNSITSVLMGGALIIATMIIVLMAWVVIRYRARRGDDSDAPQIHGNNKLELGWTIAPGILLLFIFLFATYNQFASATSPGAGLPKKGTPDIIVIGHQFWWEFRYPKLGIVTANEFHIPANKNILVQLESDDVIHDLWMPQLGEKMDNVPGKTNYTYLNAPKPGRYEGACAEYCGAEHAWMRPLAVAQSQSDFNKWVHQQQTAARNPQSKLAQQGRKLFLSNTCVNCHAIAGTSAKGRVGPDLTHVGSREQIAAGVLNTNQQNLYKFLLNPQAVKPGILMPNFHLTDQQAYALAAYLESLK